MLAQMRQMPRLKMRTTFRYCSSYLNRPPSSDLPCLLTTNFFNWWRTNYSNPVISTLFFHDLDFSVSKCVINRKMQCVSKHSVWSIKFKIDLDHCMSTCFKQYGRLRLLLC